MLAALARPTTTLSYMAATNKKIEFIWAVFCMPYNIPLYIMSLSTEIQNLSADIQHLQQQLKNKQAEVDAAKQTLSKQNTVSRLTTFLQSFTDEFIQQQVDNKRDTRMQFEMQTAQFKIDHECRTYKADLYKERDDIRAFIANPNTNTCYHLQQPFKFERIHDPYHCIYDSHGYYISCSQCDERIGTCRCDANREKLIKVEFNTLFLKTMFPLNSINFNRTGK